MVYDGTKPRNTHMAMIHLLLSSISVFSFNSYMAFSRYCQTFELLLETSRLASGQ